jgi:hypothetical protein
MKIHSRFKDYYDWVAHKYGGGDPKIVYNRERVVPAKMDGCFTYEQTVKIPKEMGIYIPHQYDSPFRREHVEYRGLVVAGRWYILAQRVERNTSGFGYRTVKPWTIVTDEPGTGGYEEKAAEIAKFVKAPVFTIEPFQYAVEGRVPILNDLGLPALLSAEQCYQEIALFLGNVLNVVPDGPAVPATDVQKAEAHGFDKRQSFRHRK